MILPSPRIKAGALILRYNLTLLRKSGHPLIEPLALNRCHRRPLKAGGFLLGGEKTLIMGILNVTPDSFFDGGQFSGIEQALDHAEKMLAAGADILDIGGESSRPGAEPVSETEELNRTLPIVQALWKKFACPISIDTTKSSVARAALEAGACIINDISAMTFDPLMLEVPQAFGAGVILNHIQGKPKDMQVAPNYIDPVIEITNFLKKQIQLLAALGVNKTHIAIDPGIGFGKSLAHNYQLIREMEKFDSLGCPILLGMSRKSLIGKTLGLENSDRLIPSIALAVYASLKGASILRVHDVKETKEALVMMEALNPR